MISPVDRLASALSDRYAIERGRSNIERLYREGGYYLADVTVDEALLESDRSVLYTVVEGPRVRVRKILFEVND